MTPGQPGSKTIKVTAQAIDHQGSGHVWLTKQEPVEVEVRAQAPATAATTSEVGRSLEQRLCARLGHLPGLASMRAAVLRFHARSSWPAVARILE